MEYKPCYSEVAGIITEASQHFGDSYLLQEEKFTRMRDICAIIDKLVPDLDAESLDVSIDETSKRLNIGFECDEMVLEHGRTSDFFKLIKMVDSFSFSKVKEDVMRVDFNIEGMWGRD